MSYNDLAFYMAEIFIENCPDALLEPAMGSLSGGKAPRYQTDDSLFAVFACSNRASQTANRKDCENSLCILTHLAIKTTITQVHKRRKFERKGRG
jgi:hypothetical protein